MPGNFQRCTSQAGEHRSSVAYGTGFPGAPDSSVRTRSSFEKDPSHLFLRSLSDCPMVVHSERDQSEHGHVKADVPPGIGTLDTVLVSESAQPRVSEGRARPGIQATSVAKQSGNPSRFHWQTTPVH